MVDLLEDKLEMRDEDACSQMSGVSETGSQMEDGHLYSLWEINDILDEPFGRTVDVTFLFWTIKRF